jgi:hypothetical protein
MKHVKRYKELFEAQTELSQEQIKWLDKCTAGKWTLNPQTGLVDVDGDFYCSDQDLTDFKGVRFGVVTDDFNCSNNRLTSLEGAPQKVGRGFYCPNNRLTSLEGAPQIVGGNFDCSVNSLTSLEDGPQTVGGFYNCFSNLLTSLEGAPQSVGRRFYCSDNQVSESVLEALYKKMRSGMSWSDAVTSHWRYIKSEEDKILLAPSNPNLSPEELKGYQALAKLRKRML